MHVEIKNVVTMNRKQSLDLHIIVKWSKWSFVIYEALDEKVMRLSRLPLSLRDDRFKILSHLVKMDEVDSRSSMT